MTAVERQRLKAMLAAVADEPGVPLFLEVPGPLQSWQRPRPNKRGVWKTPWATWKAEQRFSGHVRLQLHKLKATTWPTGSVALAVLIFVRTRAVGDRDNLEKTILDGLTKSGLWGDDRQNVQWAGRLELDREAPRVLLAVCSTRSELRG